jgi:hypothetical protein
MPKKKYDDFSVKYALAAPCGMYCGYCRQYLDREYGLKKGCEGCRIRNKDCAFLKNKCPSLKEGRIHFCHECDTFPCDNLDRLDEKYRNKYGVSLVGNLERIKSIGADRWLEEQRDRWQCPACGGRQCVHEKKCYGCGQRIRE